MPISSAQDPASRIAAVTKSDATILSPHARALYVGGAGDVAVETPDGTTATFTAVPTGTILPVQAKKVLSTGTTATAIVALA